MSFPSPYVPSRPGGFPVFRSSNGCMRRFVPVGAVVRLVLPPSEVCMAMRLAGRSAVVRVDVDGVRLDAGAGPFLTHGEAGVFKAGRRFYVAPDDNA